MSGKAKRIATIHNRAQGGVLIFCPVDDSLLAGPVGGLRHMSILLESLGDAKPSAFIAFRGTLSRYQKQIGQTPTILNCTGSIVGPNHVEKVMVHQLIDAIRLDAEAVAGHINLFSSSANEQIANFGKLCREADKYCLPALAIAYPRREKDGEDDNFEVLRDKDHMKYADLVAHAVRVAVELGADFVKTQYTGSAESFQKVVDAACGVPLLIAGGPKKTKNDALRLAIDAIGAGASGVSFGRNVFNRSNPGGFVAELKSKL